MIINYFVLPTLFSERDAGALELRYMYHWTCLTAFNCRENVGLEKKKL